MNRPSATRVQVPLREQPTSRALLTEPHRASVVRRQPIADGIRPTALSGFRASTSMEARRARRRSDPGTSPTSAVSIEPATQEDGLQRCLIVKRSLA